MQSARLKRRLLMSSYAKDYALDVDFEVVRSIHRVVRAMHDGECPRCHFLFRAEAMMLNDMNAIRRSRAITFARTAALLSPQSKRIKRCSYSRR